MVWLSLANTSQTNCICSTQGSNLHNSIIQMSFQARSYAPPHSLSKTEATLPRKKSKRRSLLPEHARCCAHILTCTNMVCTLQMKHHTRQTKAAFMRSWACTVYAACPRQCLTNASKPTFHPIQARDVYNAITHAAPITEQHGLFPVAITLILTSRLYLLNCTPPTRMRRCNNDPHPVLCHQLPSSTSTQRPFKASPHQLFSSTVSS